MKRPDFEALDKMVEEKFLRKVISPCGKLMLYNYTDKCTFDRHWNKHTLNARGTVYEVATGKVVAQAFPKFFNFGELAVSKQRNLLKKDKFIVSEKMDGSLGIIYNYEGEWRVNTRGSFTSDQAIKATEILREKYHMKLVPPSFTILVEIIYPENRIIVDYGEEEKLTILACYVEGMECNTNLTAGFSAMPMAPRYSDFKSIQEVMDEQARLGKMEEGFVVRFETGERVKFKSAEYLKVARILSNMTPLGFWRNMKNGEVDRAVLEEIPEEFRQEMDDVVDYLEHHYALILIELYEAFDNILKCIGGLTGDLSVDRRDLGLFLKENKGETLHSGCMFAYLTDDLLALDKYIMKYIRPKGNIL